MTVAIRVPPPAAAERFAAAVASAFSSEVSRVELEHTRHLVDEDRALAAYDGAEIVGTADSFPFRLSVPGGALPAAGVSAVGVVPSHRRRGILTSLMRRQLDDAHARGEPLAALWASEGSIYGRFGYGLATRNARIDAERDGVRLRVPPRAAGHVRLVSHEEALEALPPVYERVRRDTPGFHSRTRAWWEHQTLPDEEPFRRGAGPLYRAVLELDGRPEAYALYRVSHDWGEGFPANRLRVKEEVSTSPTAARELWRFLFGIDLIRRVTTRTMPLDHPLFLLVAEQPRLRFRVGDGLWLRLVDVETALAGRAYEGDGGVVLEVEDPFCPWNAGRWRVAGGEVKRVRAAAQLRLDAAALASAYLGGFSFTELLWAGQVEELRRGAVRRADALFRTPRSPWSPELF